MSNWPTLEERVFLLDRMVGDLDKYHSYLQKKMDLQRIEIEALFNSALLMMGTVTHLQNRINEFEKGN